MLRAGFALLFLLLMALLAACAQPADPGQISPEVPSPAVEGPNDPRPEPRVPTTTPEPSPTAALESPAEPPALIEYNLGEMKIAQTAGESAAELPMLPLRLDGLIGVPSTAGAHPIVLIIHDSHPGCPPDVTSGAAAWPCATGVEQRNFLGFDYLVRELAAQDYIALAINANAAYTTALGNADAGSRLSDIIDLHLGTLIEAGRGGKNLFGVDLYGRVDGQRILWIGHGRGGALAGQIISERALNDALGATYAGYGPVLGLLQVAPTHESNTKTAPADLPFDVILPACDGQDLDLRGHTYFEAAREDIGQDAGAGRQSPATSLLLERANHNDFNAMAIPDMAAGQIRPDCRLDNLPPPDEQRAFLAAYAAAFAGWVARSGQEKADAAAGKGLDPALPVPDQLFNRPVQLAIAPAAKNETLLLRPFSAGELSRNLLGGDVTPRNGRLTYCTAEDIGNESAGEAAPCGRQFANHLGNPAQILISWDQPDAALFFTLPDAGLDLTGHAAFQLRAAVDPLSPSNSPGQDQALRISLTDRQGQTATVTQESPALAYPTGALLPAAESGQERFSGPVFMGTIRIPLAEFSAVDLAAISQVGLHFDHAPAGALFLADLAFVRPQHYPGSYSTLLVNDGTLDHLRGIGRFYGHAACTAVLLDTGAPEAPAVILTNGHCAQPWSGDGVQVDVPAADMQVVFNYFANTRAVQIPVAATRVLYSTMAGRDLALVELAATQGELQARDVAPFPLAAEPPFSAEKVAVLGAPVAELPAAEAYLRQEECRVSGRASIMEFEWRFDDVYRLDCQDIYGGGSGSPVFFAGAEEISALITTTTIGGGTPCDLNAPCEITAVGPVFRHNTTYATPVDGIGRCFDPNGRFDLSLANCPLTIFR